MVLQGEKKKVKQRKKKKNSFSAGAPKNPKHKSYLVMGGDEQMGSKGKICAV